MSLTEVRKSIHDLTNCFQVVLSAIETEQYKIAAREIKKGLVLMIRIQALVKGLDEEEEARESREGRVQ